MNQEQVEKLERKLKNSEEVCKSNLALAVWATRKSDELEIERNNYRAAYHEAMRALTSWHKRYDAGTIIAVEGDEYGERPEYHLNDYQFPRAPRDYGY